MFKLYYLGPLPWHWHWYIYLFKIVFASCLGRIVAKKSHQENGHKTQRGKSLTKAAPPHFGAAEGTQAQLSWWRWWRMVAVQRLDTAQAPSLLCYHLLTAHCWSLCSPWRSVLTPHLLWCCDNQIGKEGSLKLLNIEFHFLLPSCQPCTIASQHSHERNL